MKRREKDIENAILEYLACVPGFEAWKVDTLGVYDARKGTFRRRRSGARYKGVSDIIGAYKNKAWFIEVKPPERRKRLTPEQAYFLETMRGAGQVAIVATSVEEVAEAVNNA